MTPCISPPWSSPVDSLARKNFPNVVPYNILLRLSSNSLINLKGKNAEPLNPNSKVNSQCVFIRPDQYMQKFL